MPFEFTVVVRFDRASLIKAGTRKGITENQPTTIAIKTPTMSFSHLRGKRDSGAVRPIVTAKAKTINLVRPAVTQENGGVKNRVLLNLVITSIEMSIVGTK
jgi:hypothetical protein